jgi:hypothetical protein
MWKEVSLQLPEDMQERFTEKQIFAIVFEAVQVINF